MKVVIPMAGRGQRFIEAGYTTPKMLITVLGRPMLYWALDSLVRFDLTQSVFICLKEHLDNFPLRETIEDYCREASVISIESVTGGQAETVLQAEDLIKPDEPLVIFNCDTYVKSPSLGTTIAANQSDGVISVFPSTNASFSYAELDKGGRVIQLREKEVISPFATTGFYHFAKARYFLDSAKYSIRQGTVQSSERYIAPLYNILIQQGFKFEADKAEACLPMGTPDQLSAALQSELLLSLSGGK